MMINDMVLMIMHNKKYTAFPRVQSMKLTKHTIKKGGRGRGVSRKDLVGENSMLTNFLI